MRIAAVETWKRAARLTRPYTIATRTIAAVELFFVRVRAEGGASGHGSASPAESVTGESAAACGAALSEDRLDWLVGRDPRHLGALCADLKRRLAGTPAARAALDMALHDLFARILGVPLVDVLGRRHGPLPTSITVGIQSTEQALAEAEEYLGRGFRCLKIKVGLDLEADLERLTRLRALAGPEVAIRVDANQGYDPDAARRFDAATAGLDLELIEQPLPAKEVAAMRDLPDEMRRRVAADESLHDEADALRLAGEPATGVPEACGIFNVKLMKCGGVSSALAVARIAEAAGLDMMWGCNDESAISIAAALHVAYACPTTRYVDLDGSFDLATDPGAGGFALEDGRLRVLEEPGLGTSLSFQ